MTDIVTYCDVNTCEDCPRYGDDCDGDKRVERTDYISRADAIAYIDRVIKSGLGRYKSLNYIRKYISALPSAELTLQTPQTYGKSINPSNAEVVEDYISRADAIEAVDNTDWYHINKNGEMVQGATSEMEAWYKAEDIYKALESLPSADAVHGEWDSNQACSICGCQPWYEHDIHTLHYCPNCGARMKGGAE